MRYFQVVLVNNIINAAATMLSNNFSRRIQKVLNWLNLKVLSAVISLISSCLNVILRLTANNVLNFVPFEGCLSESISASEFAPPTSIVTILEFV